MADNINEVSWQMEQLWRGCILASIAHAIMVAFYPELSNEHSWDGINYSVQDSEGARGTISFAAEYFVGVFRNDNSRRIKVIDNIKQAKEYFSGAPIEIVSLANSEALQYLLENVNGSVKPIITTAFWGTKNRTFSVDLEEEMYQNGAFLIQNQLMDFESSLAAWVEYYDMSLQQSNLLKRIFNKRIAQRTGRLVLSIEEIQQIGTNDINKLEESRISFEEIGIVCKLD